MADVTSGPERTPRVQRQTQRFGTIVVVGGGCYGGYYVRQLARAERAGALAWRALVVVDRDAHCQVAELPMADRPSALRVECAEWREYFAVYLARAATCPDDAERDAIVPSPLMPHLMADWLADRARARWPERRVATEPLAHPPGGAGERGGGDGSHHAS